MPFCPPDHTYKSPYPPKAWEERWKELRLPEARNTQALVRPDAYDPKSTGGEKKEGGDKKPEGEKSGTIVPVENAAGSLERETPAVHPSVH